MINSNFASFGKYILCIITTVLVVLLLFQFIQRPKIIKQVCEQQALERSVFGTSESSIPDKEERDIVKTGMEKKYYDSCVVFNGARP